MINGFHSHYCPRCKVDKECSLVTHCRREPTALCADCAFDDYMATQEGNKAGDDYW